MSRVGARSLDSRPQPKRLLHRRARSGALAL